MSEAKYTPGPLSIRIQPKWPFHIDTVNADGDVVFRDEMPCHSSRDRSLVDTLNCVHFDAAVRSGFAAANARAVADATLRAAAPELLEALEAITHLYETDEGCRSLPEYKAARAAIAKARGEERG